MKNYCIGIDLGGTTVKFGLFHTNGDLIEKWEIITRKENNGSYIISDIANSIQNKLVQRNIKLEEVEGVGMGVPGPTKDNGYVPICVNLGWKDCYPSRELSNLLGLPVLGANDANVAAFGEMWMGGGRGFSNVVMLTLGTGVGGGVILNSQIIAGSRGIAGELGHIVVNPDETEVCNCKNRGCLEQYASATGVVKVAKQLISERNGKSLLENFENLTAKDVFDCAKSGDFIALEATEVLGKYLAMVMATVTLTVDPDVFVIGGGVSRAGTFLLDLIRKNFKKSVTISSEIPCIRLAELGNDAGIYGAARMALQ